MKNTCTMSECEWDIKKIAETLKVLGEPVTDFMRGEGVALPYPSGEAKLELYPEKLAMRYRVGYLRLDMTDITGLATNKSGLQIRAGTADSPTIFTLRPDGSVNVTVKKSEGPSTAMGTEQPPTPEEGPSQGPAAAEATKSTEKDRVTLTGRVGREPSSRTTPNGRLVVRVPLAVHEGEETKWHQLVFFDDLGKKVADGVHKGALVSVIGYRHIREVNAKDGGKREVEEIYGATLQARGS